MQWCWCMLMISCTVGVMTTLSGLFIESQRKVYGEPFPSWVLQDPASILRRREYWSSTRGRNHGDARYLCGKNYRVFWRRTLRIWSKRCLTFPRPCLGASCLAELRSVCALGRIAHWSMNSRHRLMKARGNSRPCDRKRHYIQEHVKVDKDNPRFTFFDGLF